MLGTVVLSAAALGLAWLRWEGSAARTGSVTLIGDSLDVGVEPYLSSELSGWSIANESVVGRQTPAGVDSARTLGDRLAPVVVVSLGTNDAQEDVAGFRSGVEELMRVAGPHRCVVWSTIWRGAANTAFNDALRAAARQHANLELDDWAALVSTDEALLAGDGVHGSPEGYRRRAESIARIARRCLPPATVGG